MEFLTSIDSWIGALTIFGARLIDMSLDTLRVLFVMRGKKPIAWVLGFFQSAIFLVAITSVLSNGLENPLMMIGYAAGFATGNVLGIIIEGKLAIGYINLSIVSPKLGLFLADALREAGYAVTEIPGHGKNGMVSFLTVNVFRKDVQKIEDLIYANDPDSFIYSQEVRAYHRGFWRA
ncbi:MAG TPA: DUF5698 domain-containing protein [Anaerolineales bacterium]|nr:DUF5698 domain-containing protein [Anaerolineales bacterium]